MKNLFKDKYQRILLLLFIPALLLCGFVGYVYADMLKKVTVPDFVGKDQKEVYDWCAQLDSRYACEILFTQSKDTEEGKVISQSVKKDETLKDKITFKISNGLIAEIKLPDLSNMKKNDLEAWARVNGIENISFVEEESNLTAGSIIRVEPSSGIFKDTPITVIIAKGNGEKENSDGDIEIKSGDFYNLSVERFEQQVKNLGLVPNHLTDYDAYSDSVAKGNVVWHGSGTYVKDEKISYGVSKGINENAIIIKEDVYIDMTEDNFIAKAKELKLNPNHNTARDAYSNEVDKGRIVWHGSGSYEENETFNYGLSLGKNGSSDDSLYITEGKYVGLSAEEFESKAKALKLSPSHDTSVDAYSDTVEKGKVVWHGFGQYEENERFRYGLSLGINTNAVNVEDYKGKTESEFLSYIKGLGLKAGTKDTEYSDTYGEGIIVYNVTGKKNPGDSINYTVSLGKKQSDKIALNSFDDIRNLILEDATGNYEKAKENATNYLNNAGFTNYEFVASKSKDDGAGVLLKITVDGSEHKGRNEYAKNAKIVFTICSGQE